MPKKRIKINNNITLVVDIQAAFNEAIAKRNKGRFKEGIKAGLKLLIIQFAEELRKTDALKDIIGNPETNAYYGFENAQGEIDVFIDAVLAQQSKVKVTNNTNGFNMTGFSDDFLKKLFKAFPFPYEAMAGESWVRATENGLSQTGETFLFGKFENPPSRTDQGLMGNPKGEKPQQINNPNVDKIIVNPKFNATSFITDAFNEVYTTTNVKKKLEQGLREKGLAVTL